MRGSERAPRVMPLVREGQSKEPAPAYDAGIAIDPSYTGSRQVVRPSRSSGPMHSRTFGRVMLAIAVLAGSLWATMAFLSPGRPPVAGANAPGRDRQAVASPSSVAEPAAVAPVAKSPAALPPVAVEPATPAPAVAAPVDPPAKAASAPHWWRTLQEQKNGESPAAARAAAASPSAPATEAASPARPAAVPAPSMAHVPARAPVEPTVKPRPAGKAEPAKSEPAKAAIVPPASMAEPRSARKAPQTYEDNWQKRLENR